MRHFTNWFSVSYFFPKNGLTSSMDSPCFVRWLHLEHSYPRSNMTDCIHPMIRLEPINWGGGNWVNYLVHFSSKEMLTNGSGADFRDLVYDLNKLTWHEFSVHELIGVGAIIQSRMPWAKQDARMSRTFIFTNVPRLDHICLCLLDWIWISFALFWSKELE